MNKIEVIENTIKQIEDAEQLLRYQYTNKEKDCFCAVGHIMNVCGVDFEQLIENHELNSKAITGIIRDDDFAISVPLLDAGFTFTELEKLQSINDGNSDVDRKEEVLSELRNMMDESFPF